MPIQREPSHARTVHQKARDLRALGMPVFVEKPTQRDSEELLTTCMLQFRARQCHCRMAARRDVGLSASCWARVLPLFPVAEYVRYVE